MAVYFSTHIPGLGKVAGRQLLREGKRTVILERYDGLIIYDSEMDSEDVKHLGYFNNSYLLLGKFERLRETEAVGVMAKELAGTDPGGIEIGGKSFRIMASVANQPASIAKEKLEAAERRIASVTGLRADRTSPDAEILLLYRREGFGLAGLKLTAHRDYKKTLSKGQLRPELAYLLCLVSDPKAGEVVLDPFAGSGAILAQRGYFEYRRLISGDIKSEKKFIKKMDALSMKQIGDGSIDKIITDPPWGFASGQGEDMEKFYRKMLREFGRVLKRGGTVVVLTGAKEQFEKALGNNYDFPKREEKYDVLVSGKKAAVYKIKKRL